MKNSASLKDFFVTLHKDLKNGKGVIPKYRAIYLDSIKKDKYSIIRTNNKFDELIANFNAYKESATHLTTKDKKILRARPKDFDFYLFQERTSPSS